MEISQEDLIKNNKKTRAYWHLSTAGVPIKKPVYQAFVNGFNNTGRPEGFWLTQGSSWLHLTTVFNNSAFPSCCYIYEAAVSKKARIFNIKTVEDFEEFDKKVPNYWINYDYFDLMVYDYYEKKAKTLHAAIKDPWEKLEKIPISDPDQFKKLCDERFIFTKKADAVKYSNFYRHTDIPMYKLKHKNYHHMTKNYDGIVFTFKPKETKMMKYYWYQSLDTTSTCIWNPEVVDFRLIYYKKEKVWVKV